MGSGVPVVCSHTNASALVDNPRNISDQLIEAIASTGGVIGISAINDFNARSAEDAAVRTTPQVGLDVMLDHIEHVRRVAGVEHVALGPDFTSLRPPTSGLRPATSLSIPPEMASEQSPIIYVDGFEDIRELPNVMEGLRGRGWTDADLRALLADNWLRVYQEVWGA
jgi:membrane dipeptidase